VRPETENASIEELSGLMTPTRDEREMVDENPLFWVYYTIGKGKDRPPDHRFDNWTILYFIQAESGGPIKIGIARDPERRLATLQTGNPEPLVIRRQIRCSADMERRLHALFRSAHIQGEWFRPIPALADMANAIPDADGPDAIEHPPTATHRVPAAI
jgi:hypothetical protein